MKRYTVFVARLSLASLLSGTFVVGVGAGHSPFERAHAVVGVLLVYAVLGLVLFALKERRLRSEAGVAMILALLELVPASPMLHGVVSPFLFTSLAWAALAASKFESGEAIAFPGAAFVLPALLAIPIAYGVAYRHQAAGMTEHVGSAMLVAGTVLIAAYVLQHQHPENRNLLSSCNVVMVAAVFQVVLGMSALVIRLLELEDGIYLAVARAIHIAGAAPLLAATVILASQYRQRVPAE